MKIIKSIIRFLLYFLKISLFTLFNFFKNGISLINRKKRYAVPFYALMSYIFFVIVLVKTSGDPKFNKVLADKRVNDVTIINPVQVNKIIQPHSIQEIVEAINSTTGPISIGGGKFSMGGQTAYENSLHIDTREFNKVIELDTVKKQVIVQAGIVWKDLQEKIDPFNLSVKIMQTYANFTVGGSISVNCHGRYVGHGPIISTVLALKIVLSNGGVITASRDENQDIFYAAVGGYGGIGVIAEATLQLDDNVRVERQTKLVKVDEYNDFFTTNIKNGKDVIFQNGDLYPPHFELINNVSWKKTDKELTDHDRLSNKNSNYWIEQNLVEVVSWGTSGKWIRKNIIDPVVYSSDKVIWRNLEASYDVKELEPKSRKDQTYVLQEYFIPVSNIKSFIPKMKAIYDKYNVNVINVSLRHAFPDKESYLSWANEEVFAFVIYYKQGTDAESKNHVKDWTVEMTDAILSENGTWYLPYQPHATIAQFDKGYPNSAKYFEVKNKVDSLHRFTNKLLDKYNPYVKTSITKNREDIEGYFRPEEQTILTVPEWYLVFNSKEYADFLEAGNNPSDFPFYASIDEYWKLYDRSQKLVLEAYPENAEYNTMLQVIGVSITMEYAGKLIYENTLGKVFGLFENDAMSDQEKIILQAQRAYSDFIYDTAWYEFNFLPWIEKVWSVSDTSDGSCLRKWERTLFFTVEFTFKAGYAQLIEWAAESSYEEPVLDIYLLVSTEEQLHFNDMKIISEKGSKKIVSVPRWGAFTKTLTALNDKNREILEIGGNDEIAVSVLTDRSSKFNFENGDLLYESDVVTNKQIKRLVYFLPVRQLLSFVEYAKSAEVEVEHIFDY